LIELAYYTSMVPEEGRFPRFRLYIAGRSSNQPKMVVRWDIALPTGSDGVSMLKRLAPAAGSLDHMLVMEERDDDWHCLGLAATAPAFSPIGIGRREWHLLEPERPHGIAIRVEGPGVMKVSLYGIATLILSGGGIHDRFRLNGVPSVQRLIRRIGDELTAGLDVRRVLARDGGTVQIDIPVHFVIEHIVAHMSAAGYGGSLVFPDDANPSVLDMTKFPVTYTGLSDALVAFHHAATRCSECENDLGVFRTVYAAWQSAVNDIIRACDAIAMLSRIDGCVVLDHKLNVLSFGAKIKVGIDGLDGLPDLPLVNPLSRERIEDRFIRNLGTRNQSAFGLCKAIPNSTAIIVSQDGQIRVAGSEVDSITFLDSLEASAIDQPSW